MVCTQSIGLSQIVSNPMQCLTDLGLRNHIQLKTGEINNLRFLARCVLDQKDNLDKFFLESIDYIKLAGGREERARHKSHASERLNRTTDSKSESLEKSVPKDPRNRSVDDYARRERLVPIDQRKLQHRLRSQDNSSNNSISEVSQQKNLKRNQSFEGTRKISDTEIPKRQFPFVKNHSLYWDKGQPPISSLSKNFGLRRVKTTLSTQENTSFADQSKRRSLLRLRQDAESAKTKSVNLNFTDHADPQAKPEQGFEYLSWPEKERIVRTLCSKINKGVAPKYWQKLNNAMRERENFLTKENSLNSYNLLGV